VIEPGSNEIRAEFIDGKLKQITTTTHVKSFNDQEVLISEENLVNKVTLQYSPGSSMMIKAIKQEEDHSYEYFENGELVGT